MILLFAGANCGCQFECMCASPLFCYCRHAVIQIPSQKCLAERLSISPLSVYQRASQHVHPLPMTMLFSRGLISVRATLWLHAVFGGRDAGHREDVRTQTGPFKALSSPYYTLKLHQPHTPTSNTLVTRIHRMNRFSPGSLLSMMFADGFYAHLREQCSVFLLLFTIVVSSQESRVIDSTVSS